MDLFQSNLECTSVHYCSDRRDGRASCHSRIANGGGGHGCGECGRTSRLCTPLGLRLCLCLCLCLCVVNRLCICRRGALDERTSMCDSVRARVPRLQRRLLSLFTSFARSPLMPQLPYSCTNQRCALPRDYD